MTLFWTALFVCSLLMQYASFASAPPVAAVHDEGLFELDGNATDSTGAGLPDDWDRVFAGTDSAFDSIFLVDPINGVAAERLFTGGDSKDIADISDWLWTSGPGVQDKNDISNAYAAGYFKGDELFVYFGLDRYAANGDAQGGFWFVQDQVSLNADGTFSGEHTVGDILVQIDFENGGTDPIVRVYEWVGSGGDTSGTLDLVSEGGLCNPAVSNDTECAIPNAADGVDAPWPYDDKFDAGTGDDFPAGAFLEGGINLTALGLDGGCFTSFIAETRSSQEPTSTLSDFTLGSFALCETPNLQTQVKQNGQNASSINMGESVVDVATLTGTKGVVEGTIDFFVCGPTADPTKPDCADGGTKVGATKTLAAGTATSDPFTPTQGGWYCFRAEYDAAEGSKYLDTEHTNQTTECFRVLEADIDVEKDADAATVNAGEQIGFTVMISNTGAGLATGLAFTDNLPAGTGVSWTVDAANSDAGWSISGSAPNQSLVYTPTTLAGGASTSVHVVSNTTKDSCKVYNNTASVTTTNDGSDEDSASTEVLCAVIEVIKDADAASVSAGEQIGFTVTINNNGAGLATGLGFTDNLPAGTGVSWTIDAANSDAGWSITGTAPNQQLVYSPSTLAGGASTSVHVVSNTTKDSCKVYDNTASVTTANDGSDEDSASTEVLCPVIEIDKEADDASVNAGEQIGFTITVTNSGAGTANNVTVTDVLPSSAGLSWSIDAANSDAGCSIAAGTLTCNFGSLASGASKSVHIVSPTTAASCGQIDNTAMVTTSNDGSDQDTATTEVLCADIDVEKTADAASVNAGDQIGFTVTISNDGEGDATGVSFTDNLPGGDGVSWSIESQSGGFSITGTAPNQQLVFAPTTLAAGASATVHIVSGTTAASCKVYDNTASVTTGNDGSDTDSASTEVLCGEINVEKVADDATVNAGDQIGFTVTLTNSGDGAVNGLAFTDNLPGGDGVSWSIESQTGGFSITGTAPNQQLVFAPTSLAAGASASVHIVSDTTADSCGVYDNTATVTSTNDGSDEASDTTEVLCAEIDIEKVADDAEVVAGEQIGFVITVSNDGAGTAYDVEVMDVLPAGVTWAIDGAANGFSIVGGNLVFGPADLAAGASVSVHIVAMTDRTDCGVIDNTASVTTSNDGEDEASDSVSVRCPEIDIDKASDDADGIVGKGQTVTYTIDVTVVEGPVTGAVLTDELPEGQTYVDGSETSDPAATDFEVSADGRTLTWTWNSLSNDGATVTYDVTIDEDAAIGDQTNVAEICISEVPDCEDDDETVTVPDLTIVKSFTGNTGGIFESEDGSPLDGTPVAEIGDILTYTLTYDLTNGPVHNGVITDVLPVGLAYVTGSATGNAEFTFDSFDAATRTLTWTAPLVSADGSVTYQVLVLEGSADLPQPLVNVATIDSDETPPDDDERQVLVAEPPLVITPPPTLPPTSTIDSPSQGASNPGFSLMLVLLGLAGFTLAVGFITPVPERARRQGRR